MTTMIDYSKPYGVIYIITNKVNGKKYIGQTIQVGGFDKRYKCKTNLENFINNTHNEHLKNSIIKYGIENFDFLKEFMVCFSQEELDKQESMLIKKFNTTDFRFGYNKRDGGSNGKFSEELRFKISGESHWNYGLTGERNHNSKKVYCITNDTTYVSLGECSKSLGLSASDVSQCCNGKIYSTKGFRFIYLEDWNSMSFEEKAEYKNREKPKRWEVASKLKQRKVICLDTMVVFDSIKDASSKLGINKSTISACCNGRLKTACGFVFMHYDKYVEQQDKLKVA